MSAMHRSSFKDPGLVKVAPYRPTVLNNCTCPYCGVALSPEIISEEHVVGRRFVPKGKLNGNWNLIANACRPCNGRKSDLEDDISAITLQPDLLGQYGHGDAGAIADAQRKAKGSLSRRTKKTIRDSQERIGLSVNLGTGSDLSFSFIAPSQIDDWRAFELARMQLAALFYMQTYNSETRRGGYWLHGYHPVMQAARSDWGNSVMIAFAHEIEGWECRLVANTAEGFFRVIIRKHPSAETWAWAIEWNRSRRLIGFFGEREPAQNIVNSFPELRAQIVYQASENSLSYRVETPLSENDDILFF